MEHVRLQMMPPRLHTVVQFPQDITCIRKIAAITEALAGELAISSFTFDFDVSVGANGVSISIPEHESFYPLVKLVERVYNRFSKMEGAWTMPVSTAKH